MFSEEILKIAATVQTDINSQHVFHCDFRLVLLPQQITVNVKCQQ